MQGKTRDFQADFPRLGGVFRRKRVFFEKIVEICLT